MQQEFSKSNLYIFTEQFVANSLAYFLHSGKTDILKSYETGDDDDLPKQVDAYELVEETQCPEDKVFLLLGRNFTANKNEQLIADAFFSASKNVKSRCWNENFGVCYRCTVSSYVTSYKAS